MKRALLALAGTGVGLAAVLTYRTPPVATASTPVSVASAPDTRTLTGAAAQTR